MYQIMASEIGFEIEPDVLIKISREPANDKEWAIVSEFVSETFPLTPDEISHGFTRLSCMVYLPENEPYTVTQLAQEAGVGRQYIKDEIKRGNLKATMRGKQYEIAANDATEWLANPKRGSRNQK